MSVLDAMGYGLPVVSTNVGGIPKIVHDEENGYCCKAGDTDVMSEAITDLLMDQLKREKWQKTAFLLLKQSIHWKHI